MTTTFPLQQDLLGFIAQTLGVPTVLISETQAEWRDYDGTPAVWAEMRDKATYVKISDDLRIVPLVMGLLDQGVVVCYDITPSMGRIDFARKLGLSDEETSISEEDEERPRRAITAADIVAKIKARNDAS